MNARHAAELAPNGGQGGDCAVRVLHRNLKRWQRQRTGPSGSSVVGEAVTAKRSGPIPAGPPRHLREAWPRAPHQWSGADAAGPATRVVATTERGAAGTMRGPGLPGALGERSPSPSPGRGASPLGALLQFPIFLLCV